MPVILGWGLASLILATVIGAVFARLDFPVAHDRRRFGEIDGLRGYLALMVMVQHFLIWAHGPGITPVWVPPPQNVAHELGSGSVALFFMITGFLFGPRIEQGLPATNWPGFAIARLFRIAPLVIVSAMLVAGLIGADTGARPAWNDARTVLLWVFGRQDRNPLAGAADPGLWDAHVLWSLRWEWIFYLGFMPAGAIGASLLRKRGHQWALPVIVLALCLGFRVVCAATGRTAPEWTMFLPFFSAGAAIATLARIDRIRIVLGGRMGDCLAAGALFGGMTLWPDPFGWGLVLFAGFFLCVACGAGLGGVLRLPGALVLGECSYAIYLFHGIALAVLFRRMPDLVHALPQALMPVWMLVITAILLPVTAALHLAVERPLMLRGKRWGEVAGNRVSAVLRRGYDRAE